MTSRSDDAEPIYDQLRDEAPLDDELRSGDVGHTVEQPEVDQPEVDEIFEVDGDTTGADPDAADPAVNIRPHEPGHLA
jgi:hypothetical protein